MIKLFRKGDKEFKKELLAFILGIPIIFILLSWKLGIIISLKFAFILIINSFFHELGHYSYSRFVLGLNSKQCTMYLIPPVTVNKKEITVSGFNFIMFNLAGIILELIVIIPLLFYTFNNPLYIYGFLFLAVFVGGSSDLWECRKAFMKKYELKEK